VEETLKGVATPALRIVVSARVGLHVVPVAGERALLCLAAAPGGEWFLRQHPASSRIVLEAVSAGPGSDPVLVLARLLLDPASGPAHRTAELVRLALSGHQTARTEAAAALAASPGLLPLIPAEALATLVERAARGPAPATPGRVPEAPGSADIDYRILLAGLLCDAGAPGLLPALVQGVRGSDSTAFAEAVGRVARRLHGESAALHLVPALAAERDAPVRRLLLEALAATGTAAAVPHVVRGLDDPGTEAAARTALLRSTAPGAIAGLVGHARASGADAALRTIESLRALGNRRARAGLTAIARGHADPAVRTRASQALSR
jgi:hypothetical protein